MRPVFSPRAAFGAALLVVAACGVARAQNAEVKIPPAVKPAQIDRNGVLILVRATLLALDQANKTGNYTVFRDLAAPNFAAANNSARLAEIFAAQRNQNLDLSGVLVLDPQLTVLPEIDAAGRMRFAGFFPSVPTQVNFRLVYEAVNSQWRLGEIGVNLGPSGPVAPAAAPPAQAAPKPAPAAAAKPVEKPPARRATPLRRSPPPPPQPPSLQSEPVN